MEIFKNITDNENENSIKIGTKIPADAAGLAWFSNEAMTVDNSINFVDLSETIVENSNKKIDNENEAKVFLAYSDELGVLRTTDGSYSMPSTDISVSNVFLSKPLESKTYLESELNPKDFAHYYYISRYFIEADNSFSLISLNDFLSESIINNLGIKVVDKNSKEYIEVAENRKKYRILLEPYRTESNLSNEKIPYRVIVLFDSDTPSNLKLVYNKCESDENGAAFNIISNFSETINAMSLFTEIPEETFVIDNNYSLNKNFSIKKINEKHSELINTPIIQEGYQVVVPGKSISDNRTYELFNWRLIAQTNRSFNYEEYDYGYDINISGKIQSRNVNVAVLYSGQTGLSSARPTTNPYIFERLQGSPFNLSKYNFTNPIKSRLGRDNVETGINKNTADFWILDIDSVTDLSEYDVLAWSPTGPITASQAALLRDFLSKNGTLILDLSYTTSSATSLNPSLAVNRGVEGSTTHTLNTSNQLIDSSKNGGWPISNSIFEKSYYNVFGSKLAKDGSYKKYNYFENVNNANKIVTIGSSGEKTIGQIIPYPNGGDAIASGNLVAVSFPIMAYCNSIYEIGASDIVYDTNHGPVKASEKLGNNYAALTEGPFKLLYNIVSYALHCRTHASKTEVSLDLRSSLYNYVSEWNSSYVVNEAVLTEQEKTSDYTKITLEDNSNRYVRDLMSERIRNSGSFADGMAQDYSVFGYYKSSLANFLPDSQISKLYTLNSSEVDFYIEITNQDVEIVNATRVANDNDIQKQSSYFVHQISSAGAETIAYAYTDKPSAPFNIPSQMYSHSLIEKNISLSNNKKLSDNFNALSAFKEYPFALSCIYNYFQSREKHTSFDADVDLRSTGHFNAVGSIKRMPRIYRSPTPAKDAVWANNIKFSCKNVESGIDDLGLLRTDDPSSSNNIFPYTGDIDIHGETKMWQATSYDPRSGYLRFYYVDPLFAFGNSPVAIAEWGFAKTGTLNNASYQFVQVIKTVQGKYEIGYGSYTVSGGGTVFTFNQVASESDLTIQQLKTKGFGTIPPTLENRTWGD